MVSTCAAVSGMGGRKLNWLEPRSDVAVDVLFDAHRDDMRARGHWRLLPEILHAPPARAPPVVAARPERALPFAGSGFDGRALRFSRLEIGYHARAGVTISLGAERDLSRPVRQRRLSRRGAPPISERIEEGGADAVRREWSHRLCRFDASDGEVGAVKDFLFDDRDLDDSLDGGRSRRLAAWPPPGVHPPVGDRALARCRRSLRSR